MRCGVLRISTDQTHGRMFGSLKPIGHMDGNWSFYITKGLMRKELSWMNAEAAYSGGAQNVFM